MSTYPNHDWRTDDFTLIRGRYTASVTRAWCADDGCKDPWRWVVWAIAADGTVDDVVPEGVERHGFTFAEAIAAAERFIEEREREETFTRHARFEGVPGAPEACF